MNDAEGILAEYAQEHGWDERRQSEILMRFIEQMRRGTKAFEDFLRRKLGQPGEVFQPGTSNRRKLMQFFEPHHLLGFGPDPAKWITEFVSEAGSRKLEEFALFLEMYGEEEGGVGDDRFGR